MTGQGEPGTCKASNSPHKYSLVTAAANICPPEEELNPLRCGSAGPGLAGIMGHTQLVFVWAPVTELPKSSDFAE